jgi:hypothetical protein
VMPAPRVVLEEAAGDLQFVGQGVEFGAGVGEQVAELGVAQAPARVGADGVDVAGHAP